MQELALPTHSPVPQTPGRGKQLRDLTMDALALFRRKKFHPLEELITCFKEIQDMDKEMVGDDPEVRISAKRLKFDVIKEIVQYGTPKLRSVEHTGEINTGITVIVGGITRPEHIKNVTPVQDMLERLPDEE